MSTRDVMDSGISIIYQELALVQQMSVAENIFLGREPHRFGRLIDYGEMNLRATRWLQLLDLEQSLRFDRELIANGAWWKGF